MLEGSSRDSSCLIVRGEFEWALDCVQTRNCRLPLEIEGGVEGREEAGGVEQETEEMQYEGSQPEPLGPCVGIDYDNEYLPTQLDPDSSNDIPSAVHVVAPFFDLMNHNQEVNTVFQLIRRKSCDPDDGNDGNGENGKKGGNDSEEDILTVRYEGHGVKKGDQICLNYRK